MPIYEYHCSKCGDFEVMQRISDKELRTCPTCRRKVTKLISNTTFHLKGSGWYITDYARKGQGAADASADKKTDGKTDGKTEGKTESTSESSSTKSESKTKSSDKGKKGAKAKSAA